MGRPRLCVTRYSSEELKSLLRKDEKYMLGVRLHAVYQVSLGAVPRSLEKAYGVCFRSICTWVNEVNKHGIEGLKDKIRSGRPSRLSEEKRAELKRILLSDLPEQYGYNTGTWNGILIIDLLEKKFGIKYRKAQIYNILRDLGFSFKKGRGVYPESDEERRKEFCVAIKKNRRK